MTQDAHPANFSAIFSCIQSEHLIKLRFLHKK